MRITLSAIALLLSIVSIGMAQSDVASSAKTSKAERQIHAIYKEWDGALATANVRQLERLLAQDHLFTTEDGTMMSKDQILAGLKSGESVISFCVSTVNKIIVQGDTAVVAGVWRAEQKTRGKDTSGSFRFTDTWFKREGRWQCVADHVSKLKAEK